MKMTIFAYTLALLFAPQTFAQYVIGSSVSYIECKTANQDSYGTDYFAYKVGKPFRGSDDLAMEVWHVNDSYRRIENTFQTVKRTVDSKKITTINTGEGLVLQYKESSRGEFAGQVIEDNRVVKVICDKIPGSDE